MNLLGDEKVAVHEMLRFMYTADYDDEHTSEDPCFTPMLLDVQMHTIADKYNIPALANLATRKFATRALTAWNTTDFAYAIEEMFTTAPESQKSMRDCAIYTTIQHAKALYTHDLGLPLRDMASRTPGFASELAARLVDVNIVQPLSKFYIKVQTLTGKAIDVEIKPRYTIQRIKECVQIQEGIPAGHQVFIFNGEQLEDEATAAECKIQEGSRIDMVLSLRGS